MLGINDQKDLSERRLRKLIQSHVETDPDPAPVENKINWFELVSAF